MTKVLIVAHGQPGDPEPQQQAVETLAARIAPHLPQAQVGGATLAMPGALNIATADTLIYPMFMASGWFTRSELPRRLALAGFDGENYRLCEEPALSGRLLAAAPEAYAVGVGLELMRLETVAPLAGERPLDLVVTEAGAFRPQ